MELIKLTDSKADKVAQYYNYTNAETFKTKQGFKPSSKFNIKYEKGTDALWIVDSNDKGENTTYTIPKHLK